MKNIQWKPIQLDKEAFESDLDGLIGIEECTDYDLDEIIKGQREKRKHIDSSSSQTPQKRQKKLKTIKNNEDENQLNFSPSKEGSTTPSNIQSFDSFREEDLSLWLNFGLPKVLLKALHSLNFKEPTRIQSLTLPAAILGRRDILGAAETGSGKTLAFGLPILSGILETQSKDTFSQSDKLNNGGKPLYALILTPTRELAVQVKNHLVAAAKFTDIKVAVVVGGMAAVKQERILSKGPEIVVATPGRLWELIQMGNPHLSQIDNIKYLAIDETDRMLEKGHFEELHNLLERLNLDENKRKQRQNFVFSATLTLVHELPKYLASKKRFTKKITDMKPELKLKQIIDILGITNPKIVDVGGKTSTTLTECRITCAIDEKDYYVYYFLQKHSGRTLIFCNSIGCVRRLTHLLGLLGYKALSLHASMQQRQRLKNLERFRDDPNGILVATDVAARGLDIPNVEHVIHYQTPRTSESYVHRSGRTARASKEGITILIMEPTEFQNYLKLCRTLRKDQDLPIFPVQENYLNAVKQRVNLARDLDKLELHVRKANSETGWLEKAAKDMDIIVDEFVRKFDSGEAKSTKKHAEVKRKQLTALLAKPIFPKGFSGKYPLTSEVSMQYIETKKEDEKAVDVMKKSLKQNSVKLYKPRKYKNK